MANLVLDFLMSEARDHSHGSIDFPTEYPKCYSYLQSSVYGAPGKWRGEAAFAKLPASVLVELATHALLGEAMEFGALSEKALFQPL